ncbi:hypothetical protein P691DRAFT_344494 [Macrolepiota fuliginosa MF-IS2]|uniref:C2H2-type domain-containing protein n=1 Tax=Macrolepiota fuliginosa MF-IS2 TaxID=1400762 RepID=A0A9P5XIX5_9AGAR|nr:hypothetical protein P691DRAFT_344494 [Macrolepiota fuliginosa MF-IS2]
MVYHAIYGKGFTITFRSTPVSSLFTDLVYPFPMSSIDQGLLPNLTPYSSGEGLTKPVAVQVSVPSETESVVCILERCMFVRASDLLAETTLATKNSEGEVTWVSFGPTYHSNIVKAAVATVKSAQKGAHKTLAIKEGLFIFILDILNGRPQVDFFVKKEIERGCNRANRERKRLARKRQRAARRERVRESELLKAGKRVDPAVLEGTVKTDPVDGQTRRCSACHKRFASRKKLSKHKCVTSTGDAPVNSKGKRDVGVSEAVAKRRLRRARNRQNKRLRQKAEKAAAEEREFQVAVAAKILELESPVTDGSGRESCENCEVVASMYVHGVWPKCATHGAYRVQAEVASWVFESTPEKVAKAVRARKF